MGTHQLVPHDTDCSVVVLPVDETPPAPRRRLLATFTNSSEERTFVGRNEEGQQAYDWNQQTRLQTLSSVTTGIVAGGAAYIGTLVLYCAVSSMTVSNKLLHYRSQAFNTQVVAFVITLCFVTTLILLLFLMLYKFYHVVLSRIVVEARTNNCSSTNLVRWGCLALRFVAGAALGVYVAEVLVHLLFQGPLSKNTVFRGLWIACLFAAAVYTSGSITSAAATHREQQQQSQQRRRPSSSSQSEPLLSV